MEEYYLRLADFDRVVSPEELFGFNPEDPAAFDDFVDEVRDKVTGRLSSTPREKIKVSRSKGPEFITRLEVPFNDRKYLRELGKQAVDRGLVTGFTIEKGDTAYKWDGAVVEGQIFVLKATVPDDPRTRLAYQHFYEGINERWEIPVVYVDRSLSANPDFVQWMRTKEAKGVKLVKEEEEEKQESNSRWRYKRGCINLWSSSLEPWEDDQIVDKDERVCIATLVPTREYGLIVPKATKVVTYPDLHHTRLRPILYAAIENGRGLSRLDREMLRRGKRDLGITVAGEYI